MAQINYNDNLGTDRDKVRFYIADKVEDAGPRPSSNNFTDDELDGLVTAEGSWARAVAAIYEILAAEWAQYSDIQVGTRRERFSQVSDSYHSLAQDWRRRYGATVTGGAGTRFVTRVDGYSDDIASDEV